MGKVIERLRLERGWHVNDLAGIAGVMVRELAHLEATGEAILAVRTRIVKALAHERVFSPVDRAILDEWELPQRKPCVDGTEGAGAGGNRAHMSADGAKAQPAAPAPQNGGRPDLTAGSALPGTCRGCGGALDFTGRIADGCPCNSPRGINHGLVPRHLCTCTICDPAQTGSSRPPTTTLDAAIEKCRAAAERIKPTEIAPGLPKVMRLAGAVTVKRLVAERGLMVEGDLDVLAVLPDAICTAAYMGEPVEVYHLDRIIAALDAWRALKPWEWIHYLSETFAIDGWNPVRCEQLLSKAGFVTGVRA
jgi:hypothetical protein